MVCLTKIATVDHLAIYQDNSYLHEIGYVIVDSNNGNTESHHYKNEIDCCFECIERIKKESEK